MAADKNIGLLTTGILGRKSREILTLFKLSDDGRFVTECPEGYTPNSSSYIRQNNSIRVSFQRCCYKNCPHQKECNAKIKSRTAVIIFSLGAPAHTEENIQRKDDETMKPVGRKRNGVETVPSVLRRKYLVEIMLVRGKLKAKALFSLKMFALSFSKLCLHERGLEKCRPLQTGTV